MITNRNFIKNKLMELLLLLGYNLPSDRYENTKIELQTWGICMIQMKWKTKDDTKVFIEKYQDYKNNNNTLKDQLQLHNKWNISNPFSNSS